MTGSPALQLLFGGYLNFDWLDEYGDPWRAVDDFISSEPIAQDLRAEIGEALATHRDEAALRSFVVDELRSGYLAEADGWRYETWLAELARRADERAVGDAHRE